MQTKRLIYRVAILSGALLFFTAKLHATCDSPKDGFTGAIDDKYPIVLVMDTGYAYNTSDHVIPIKSEITTTDHVSHVTIHELDEKGQPAAVFEGTFQDTDPRGHYSKGSTLHCEVLIGSWKSLKDGRVLPFYLQENGSPMGGYDESEEKGSIEKSAIAFRRAVVNGDKTTVAHAIQYPITAYLDGEREHQKKIKTSADFLAVYDRIFLPRYVKKITEDVPLLMFNNSQGIMLGDGDVWFDFKGKVIVLNSIDLNNPSLLERLAPNH